MKQVVITQAWIENRLASLDGEIEELLARVERLEVEHDLWSGWLESPPVGPWQESGKEVVPGGEPVESSEPRPTQESLSGEGAAPTHGNGHPSLSVEGRGEEGRGEILLEEVHARGSQHREGVMGSDEIVSSGH